MKRFLLGLAARDTLRQCRPLANTIATVAGIGLPLALLLGLSAGVLTDMEQALRRSPTARLIATHATGGHGAPLTPELEARLLQQPGVESIIEDVHKVVALRRGEGGPAVASVTLLPTQSGDPLLALYRADVLGAAEDGLVLSRTTAVKLAVRHFPRPEGGFRVEPGQDVDVQVTRDEGSRGPASATVRREVRAVADFGGEAHVGYAHRQLLRYLEDYQLGRPVPELGWPARAQHAVPAYEAYLCFSKQPLSALDVTQLASRGLTPLRLDPADPEHRERRTLGGLLGPHGLEVYSLYASAAAGVPQLTLTAQEVEDCTDADDVVVPWSTPLTVRLAARPCRLVGVTLAKRWLRGFFRDPAGGFTRTDPEAQIDLDPGLGPPAAGAGEVQLRLPSGKDVVVTARPRSAAAAVAPLVTALAFPPWELGVGAGLLAAQSPAVPAPPLGVVPADCLAHLHALERGEVQYEPALRLFVPATRDHPVYQFRVYARTLEDVPRVDTHLKTLGYATRSERSRIEEIQGYARAMYRLEGIVGGLVFVFGIWVLVTVFAADTARKHPFLAQLRVMGASRGCILWFVLARATLIGLLAGVVLFPAGLLAAWGLTASGVLCLLRPVHLAGVSGLAVVSCLAGAVGPALRASRLDPAIVLTEARQS